MTDQEKLASDALALGQKILKDLEKDNIEPILAMVAMGDTWVRLCQAMSFDKEWFEMTCKALAANYQHIPREEYAVDELTQEESE